MTVTVTVKDHGAKRARELLKRPRKELWLGVLRDQAQQQHWSGNTIGQIAFWMEKGTGMSPDEGVPARSWLFDWLEENRKIITQQLGADTARVLFAKPPESEEKALSKRGGEYRRSIWIRILAVPGDWKGLQPDTIRKKGHATPLIDMAQFTNAIRWEVR
jgi:hypothetical protein